MTIWDAVAALSPARLFAFDLVETPSFAWQWGFSVAVWALIATVAARTRVAIWAAIVTLSLGWLFAFDQFVTPRPDRLWGLAAVAWALASAALARERVTMPLTVRHLILLIPIAVALALVEKPFHPGLWIAAAGVALSVGANRFTRPGLLAAVGTAGLLVGTLLVIQAPLYGFYNAWTARNPGAAPFVAPVVYRLLDWVGADANLADGVVFLRTMRYTHALPLTWNHLAGFPFLLIAVAGGLLIAWDQGSAARTKRIAVFLAVLAGYLIFRFFAVLLFFASAMLFVSYESESVHVELFWLPWITALSFLPLIPILARLLPWRGAFGTPVLFSSDKVSEPNRARWLVPAACLMIVVGLYFHDPGIPKKGRLLIDESRSRWERTDTPMDTDWYGPESGYNYWAMAQYLRHYYDVGVHAEGALTPERLADCDVLVLKTATAPYSPAEIDAVDAFVRAGGGLFILGEHTNVFGSSVYLNPVMRRFGMAFRYDCVFDIERKWEELHFPSRLGCHPIARGVPFFLFAVSCSIQADSFQARSVLRPEGLWHLPISYTADNFYPQVLDHTYALWGSFDQMMTVEAGKGRVAAFTDSTVFSNFDAFYPGKPELLLGSIEWLNRANRWGFLNGLALAAGILGLAIALWIGRGFLSIFVNSATAVFWGAGLVVAGLWGTTHLAEAAYPPAVPKIPPVEVIFSAEDGNFELPLFGFLQNDAAGYEVFYQWVLRVGCFPRVSLSLAEALDRPGPAVVIRPRKKIPAEALAKLRPYLERGGVLLVLEGPTHPDSSADTLLAPYGLAFSGGPCRGTMVVESSGNVPITSFRGAQAVSGGTPLLTTDAGDTVLAFTRVGKGMVVAAGLAETFADPAMGGSHRALPDKDLRARYEMVFSLVRGIARGAGAIEEEFRKLGAVYQH